jgi:2-amino-4-hydroxy-6-hydroxymethyldihydropteridine diphosphokinase / dihydropteroate synthase
MRNSTVAFGLGSNTGPALENLRKALSALKQCTFLEVLDVSAIYESEALLPQDAQDEWNKPFLNAVVLCRLLTEINIENILTEIKKIEMSLGRKPAEKWAPRIIDIDILYWSEAEYKTAQLNVPHAELFKRPFALLPLLEVWPNLKIEKPHWSQAWVTKKPFGTKKSKRYFWPKMVGILNVTSDSFSDGGLFLKEESLHRHINLLVEQGAEIIDIGAESTRPGATAVTHHDEYKILNWALGEIRKTNYDVNFSLDCRHPSVVRHILENYKIDYLNDVTGFEDPGMLAILKESNLKAFVMHSLGVPPQVERVLSADRNPCAILAEWWQLKKRELVDYGVEADKIIFDPGVGFGKSKEQSLYVLQHLEEFCSIKEAIMIGPSRKSFQTLFSDRRPDQRDLETALVTQSMNKAYTQYLRMHDIETQIIALRFN